MGQPKLIDSVARSVGNDNNGLHTEPFLGRASVLCFLYGPGEPGRYHAKLKLKTNRSDSNAKISIFDWHGLFGYDTGRSCIFACNDFVEPENC